MMSRLAIRQKRRANRLFNSGLIIAHGHMPNDIHTDRRELRTHERAVRIDDLSQHQLVTNGKNDRSHEFSSKNFNQPSTQIAS